MTFSESLDRVCVLLTSPSVSNIEGAAEILEGLCGNAVGVQAAFSPQLRAPMRRARMLLERAREFHENWSRIASVKWTGYGPCGAAPPVSRSAVCLDA